MVTTSFTSSGLGEICTVGGGAVTDVSSNRSERRVTIGSVSCDCITGDVFCVTGVLKNMFLAGDGGLDAVRVSVGASGSSMLVKSCMHISAADSISDRWNVGMKGNSLFQISGLVTALFTLCNS